MSPDRINLAFLSLHSQTANLAEARKEGRTFFWDDLNEVPMDGGTLQRLRRLGNQPPKYFG